MRTVIKIFALPFIGYSALYLFVCGEIIALQQLHIPLVNLAICLFIFIGFQQISFNYHQKLLIYLFLIMSSVKKVHVSTKDQDMTDDRICGESCVVLRDTCVVTVFLILVQLST